MIVFFSKSEGQPAARDRVVALARELGRKARSLPTEGGGSLRIEGPPDPAMARWIAAIPGVEVVLPLPSGPARVLRDPSAEPHRIRVDGLEIGAGSFTLVAGPCAVEDAEQMLGVARAVRSAGADLLRGGAFKPRTSPYDFQGLGAPGLALLARAREETGLPVISEAIDETSLAQVSGVADVVQIGARNMQNFALLKRAGACGRPVFLKRGMSATIEDLLMSAEYVLSAGNPDVILCERGIRTFSNHSRFTLDLGIVPVLKRVTHLPVFVDPSHASGSRDSVAPLSRAALACGADGVMVEVHPEPQRALCDGPQSLSPEEFASLASTLRRLAPLFARQPETVS